MKKTIGLALLALLPAFPQAADLQVNIDNLRIQRGGTTISFGDRDKRGYYWDGRTWRDPAYWEEHHGKGKGQHCPPGQAKKGRCAPPQAHHGHEHRR